MIAYMIEIGMVVMALAIMVAVIIPIIMIVVVIKKLSNGK